MKAVGYKMQLGTIFGPLAQNPARAACSFCESGDTVEVDVVIHFRQEVICDAEDTFDRFA